MGYPGLRGSIIRGVLEAGGLGLRWTDQHPAFSFMPDHTKDLDLYMNFGVHERTFADTGPVTLSIIINGELIDRPRFDSAGMREYSHLVPSRVLQLKYPVEVQIDVDPPWIAAGDQQKLGIVLVAIGFEEHSQ
jgi:hypothetical protein